jgi:hypothetical protein
MNLADQEDKPPAPAGGFFVGCERRELSSPVFACGYRNPESSVIDLFESEL